MTEPTTTVTDLANIARAALRQALIADISRAPREDILEAAAVYENALCDIIAAAYGSGKVAS